LNRASAFDPGTRSTLGIPAGWMTVRAEPKKLSSGSASTASGLRTICVIDAWGSRSTSSTRSPRFASEPARL
jgi:hypothetical protein